MRGRSWKLVIYILLLGFILNLAGIVSHVVVSAFAKTLVRQATSAGLHNRLVHLCLDRISS